MTKQKEIYGSAVDLREKRGRRLFEKKDNRFDRDNQGRGGGDCPFCLLVALIAWLEM